jgi:hypothetical protein
LYRRRCAMPHDSAAGDVVQIINTWWVGTA